MPFKPTPKPEDLIGKVYRAKASDNAKVLSWHMVGRLREGDLLLCVDRGPGKTQKYLLLFYDLNGLRVYPSAMTFLAEPIGEEIVVPDVENLLTQVAHPAPVSSSNGQAEMREDVTR